MDRKTVVLLCNMASTAGEELKQEQAAYAKKHKVPQLLSSLLQEVLLAKPKDPIAFLQDLLTEKGVGDEAETTKKLQEIHNAVAEYAADIKALSAEDVVVALNRKKVLRSRFPTYAPKLGQVILNEGVNVDWDTFRVKALEVLSGTAV